MTNNKSFYHALNGEFVVVTIRTNNLLGKLVEDSHDTLILKPCLVNEPKFTMTNGRVEAIPFYRVEENKPTIINTIEVQAVQPTTEQHFRDIAETYSKSITGGNPYEL